MLSPATRHDQARLRVLLAQEFREFGSSGLVYDREAILIALQQEAHRDAIRAYDFYVVCLAPEAALVTYTTERSSKDNGLFRARRSSVWIYRDARWQMLFHQGTPAS